MHIKLNNWSQQLSWTSNHNKPTMTIIIHVGVKSLTNVERCKFTFQKLCTINFAQFPSWRINFISFQVVCTLNSLSLWFTCLCKLITNLIEVWFVENFNSQLPNEILNHYLCCSYYLVHNVFLLKWKSWASTIEQLKRWATYCVVTRSRTWRE